MSKHLLHGFSIWRGGNRRGAQVTVRNADGKKIHGDVVDWLDDDLRPCVRKNARYCQIRSWLSDMQMPDAFCVKVNEPPVYYSKTFAVVGGKRKNNERV